MIPNFFVQCILWYTDQSHKSLNMNNALCDEM